LGSTIQTAGFDPAAVSAVHGNVISAAGLVPAVPAMALPSVIAGGGFWIAAFTRPAEILGSTAGDISLRNPLAVTWASESSASDTRPCSTSVKKIDSGTSNIALCSPS